MKKMDFHLLLIQHYLGGRLLERQMLGTEILISISAMLYCF